jgi:hypothetical protein
MPGRVIGRPEFTRHARILVDSRESRNDR